MTPAQRILNHHNGNKAEALNALYRVMTELTKEGQHDAWYIDGINLTAKTITELSKL